MINLKIFVLSFSITCKLLGLSLIASNEKCDFDKEINQKNSIVVCTYNIATNFVRVEEGWAYDSHPEWHANERASPIKQTIDQVAERHHPDFWLFQEARQSMTKHNVFVDSVTPLKDHLIQMGYTPIVTPYNQTGDKCFYYISAYNKNNFELLETKVRYFTKTPDYPTFRKDMTNMSKEEQNRLYD